MSEAWFSMAKPFSFSTKRAGGNIYVQFALPDGGRTYQKSTGTNNRKEAEKIAMQWLVKAIFLTESTVQHQPKAR